MCGPSIEARISRTGGHQPTAEQVDSEYCTAKPPETPTRGRACALYVPSHPSGGVWKGYVCNNGASRYQGSRDPESYRTTVPPRIGASNSLSWRDCYLNGTIPTELGYLSELTRLTLSTNKLTGTIPTELGRLSELTELELSNNALNGTNSAELGLLSDLAVLYLFFNRLTGTIPTEFGLLSNLGSLPVNSLFLTGTVPSLDLSTAERLRRVG